MPHLVFPNLYLYLATCLILAVAQMIYVLFGFGAGLIAVGSLALFYPDMQDAVVLLMLVNFPAELWVVIHSRKEIRWRPILGLGSGIALGIPLGTWFLKTGDTSLVLTILGVFLVAVGLVFLRLPAGGNRRPPPLLAPPTGLLSGVLTGLFGTGGPPLIIWYQLTTSSKAAFRGNLMTIFLMMTFVRVPSYIIGGLVTAPRLWSALAVMPAVLAGAWLGNRLHLEISERRFRTLVSILLVILGLLQIIHC